VNCHRSREEHQVIKLSNRKKFVFKFINMMIFIYLIILIISMNDILTTNILKNSSLNHFIIIASCQIDKSGLESSKKDFYFYSINSILIRNLSLK